MWFQTYKYHDCPRFNFSLFLQVYKKNDPSILFIQTFHIIVCRACSEDDETLEHYFFHCPSFTNNKSQFFVNSSIPVLNQLRSIELRPIQDYVTSTEFLALIYFSNHRRQMKTKMGDHNKLITDSFNAVCLRSN